MVNPLESADRFIFAEEAVGGHKMKSFEAGCVCACVLVHAT